jgi:hypothetical protein
MSDRHCVHSGRPANGRPFFLELLMENVTNRLLAQILLQPPGERTSQPLGWPVRSQVPAPLTELPSRPEARSGETWERSPSLEFPLARSPFNNVHLAQSPAPDDCLDDPKLPSISTHGHDFCTRNGSFTLFPPDPKTRVRRFTSEGSFTGRDPRGNIRTYPGGSTISVSPDGTVTVDSDI